MRAVEALDISIGSAAGHLTSKWSYSAFLNRKYNIFLSCQADKFIRPCKTFALIF